MPKKTETQHRYRIEFDSMVNESKINSAMSKIECPMCANSDLFGGHSIDCSSCTKFGIVGNGYTRTSRCHKLLVYTLGGECTRSNRGRIVRLNGGGTISVVRYIQTVTKR